VLSGLEGLLECLDVLKKYFVNLLGRIIIVMTIIIIIIIIKRSLC